MNKYLDKNLKGGNSGSHLIGHVFFVDTCSQHRFLLYFIVY